MSEDSSRTAFELWGERNGVDLKRARDGYYSIITQSCWDAWRTARNSALEEAAKVCDLRWDVNGDIVGRQHIASEADQLARAIRALKGTEPPG